MDNFDLEREVRKISEAYCLIHNLPVRRKFTDAELDEATERVRRALLDQQPLEMSDFSPHVHLGGAGGNRG